MRGIFILGAGGWGTLTRPLRSLRIQNLFGKKMPFEIDTNNIFKKFLGSNWLLRYSPGWVRVGFHVSPPRGDLEAIGCSGATHSPTKHTRPVPSLPHPSHTRTHSESRVWDSNPCNDWGRERVIQTFILQQRSKSVKIGNCIRCLCCMF